MAVDTRDLEALHGGEQRDARWAVCSSTAIARPDSDRNARAERALEPTARLPSTWRCCYGQREVPPITAARIRWAGIAVDDDYQASTTAVDAVEAQLAVARTKPCDAPGKLHWSLGLRRLGRILKLRAKICAAARCEAGDARTDQQPALYAQKHDLPRFSIPGHTARHHRRPVCRFCADAEGPGTRQREVERSIVQAHPTSATFTKPRRS